ncbi:hypothetical protein TrLO_g15967 [Triparma laevis f. longispina]|uniref:Uncharacterized protein n=1 Tax=Triparma laevis f. longispina TaxID=1714387 RepID=A0A9W7FA63_9STRA|nr:hypothetical protein TrLO_g15967 [Triparma laevis f. longispina]
MSKSVASETHESHESYKMGGKRGAGDKGDEDEEDIFEGFFRIKFVEFVPVDALMALKSATKAWKAVVEEVIDEGVASHTMMVHDGKDISYKAAETRVEGRELVTRVVFLLNITNVRNHACMFAADLFFVDVPEGVKSIGQASQDCSSLDNVDLLHTNLQEIGACAFYECSEQTSMMIPDSLQTLNGDIFYGCSKLVPSNIDVNDTNAVVTHLESLQN